MISFSFFIISFIPLWAIFLVKLFLISDHEYQSILLYIGYALIALIVVCISIVFYFLKLNNKKDTGDYYDISKPENITSEQTLYAIAYITPFISTDFSNLESTVSIFILLLVIATIFTREKMFYVNPILMWFGYRFYKTTVSDKKFVLICKQPITKSCRLRAKKITEEIILEVSNNN